MQALEDAADGARAVGAPTVPVRVARGGAALDVALPLRAAPGALGGVSSSLHRLELPRTTGAPARAAAVGVLRIATFDANTARDAAAAVRGRPRALEASAAR